jgi:hypothetical protein
VNRQDRAKKKQKIKAIKLRAKKAITYLAMCKDGTITRIDEAHFDWTTAIGGKCNCLKCADLYAPNTVVGVVIKGMIMASKRKSGEIFVDLGNQKCYALKESGPEPMLDRMRVDSTDGKIVRLIIEKFESKLAGLL